MPFARAFAQQHVAAVFLLLCSPVVVGYSAPTPQPQISVVVNLVTVPVTVSDARGAFVSGLKVQNFRLLLDGAEQPIEYFASDQQPAQVLILIETGPAVYLLRHEHISAAAVLLNGLAPADTVAIASYSDILRLHLNFTTNKEQAAAALGSLNYGLGLAQLNFYDSLGAAVDWITAGEKRSLIVMATGLDSSGTTRWPQLEAKLRQSNVMVLPVALGGELRDTKGTSRRKNSRHSNNADDRPAAALAGEPHLQAEMSFAESDRAFEAIAAETGGHAFFPRSASDFEQAYARIASVLRHSYSVGFHAAVHDGRYHAIQVQIVDDRGQEIQAKGRGPAYRVNARRGFLAPAQ
jgi:Ca-activated chloride channel family protein